MKAYLAVFLGYEDNDIVRENLLEFDSVKELDDYTKMFEDSSSVKRKFQSEIQEFILDNRFHKKYKETKEGKPIVFISTYTINDQKGFRFIKTFYKNEKNIIILTIDELINKMTFIIERIKNYSYEINNKSSSDDVNEYLRELSFFRIKFTGEELDYLRRYICGFDERYLEKFTSLLRRRLNRIPQNKLYGMLRFNVIKMKKEYLRILEKYSIEHEFEKELIQIKENNSVIADCNDEKFINLVNKENYEKLFNNYDLDEIIRYSEGDKPLGARRK